MYIYIKKMSVTAAIAGTIAKKVFSLAAKDRNILIPLDDIKNTKIITDADLKKCICPEISGASRGKIKRKTNLEKVLER
jgi:hypothetical protein